MKKTGYFLLINNPENYSNQVNSTTTAADIAGIGNKLLERQLWPGWLSVLSSSLLSSSPTSDTPTPQLRS